MLCKENYENIVRFINLFFAHYEIINLLHVVCFDGSFVVLGQYGARTDRSLWTATVHAVSHFTYQC